MYKIGVVVLDTHKLYKNNDKCFEIGYIKRLHLFITS